jgi:hypothetical protein
MRILIAAAALIAMTGCTAGSKFASRPVGISGGANGLKRAPCAGCEKRPQQPGLPLFLQPAGSVTVAG